MPGPTLNAGVGSQISVNFQYRGDGRLDALDVRHALFQAFGIKSR